SNGYKILSFQTYKAVCLIPQVYRVSLHNSLFCSSKAVKKTKADKLFMVYPLQKSSEAYSPSLHHPHFFYFCSAFFLG
ncbi:hypothetical protein, partial [Phocaeicola vulgatus]|uniref:hypothetical protein n=1 Tax=Phocaeicola vulgatus TaxID=821 RepID=UPI003564B5DD